MGTSQTLALDNDELYSYRLGAVRVKDHLKGDEQVLYFRPDQDLFVMRPGETVFKTNPNYEKSTSYSDII